jgi:DNA adenine methylase
MPANKLNPFVKWAGGKKQLIARLRERMPAAFGRYYEPFIGGGALLLDMQPQRAVINDVNEQLLNVYRQLRADPQAVLDAVAGYDAAPCDRDFYLSVREAYNRKIAAGQLDAACAGMMIWINKHCFNGLYRVNTRGLFNVPYNNRSGGVSVDGDNLRAISAYLRQAQVDIRQGDFEAACGDVQAGDFVYFDSPYVPVSETANFTDYAKGGFSLDDHRRLAELFRRLDGLGAYVMLSNHDVPLVRELYQGYRVESVAVRRSINRDATRRTGQEVIITNYGG